MPSPLARTAQGGDGPVFYHGTSHEFAPGELVTTGHPSNYEGGPHDPLGSWAEDHAYFTTEPEGAERHARNAAFVKGGHPHVYEVEPTGPYEPTPADRASHPRPVYNYWSAHPLRVIRRHSAIICQAAAEASYVVYHGAHHDDVPSIMASGLRGEPGQPTVTTSRDGGVLYARKRDWTAPKVLEIHVPRVEVSRYLDEPEQGLPVEGTVHALRQTLPPAFIHAVHEAALQATAVRAREPGSDHGLPVDASRLGTLYHSTPFKHGFPHDEWMHVGTRAAAEDRAHAINPADFGLPKETPIYMHSLTLRGRVYPKVIDDGVAHDMGMSGYTDEVDEGYPSGSGYHVFPYRNHTEGKSQLSYLVHKSAIVHQGTEEYPRPESNPMYHSWYAHQRGHLHVYEADSHHTAAWMPSSGIFGPTTGLDSRLFNEQFRLRPEVTEAVMERLDRCIRTDSGLAGSDWQDWTRVYITGGSASEWAGSRPNEAAQDLDVIVAIDLAEAQQHSAFEGMNAGEAASALNRAFWRCFNADNWHAPSGGIWNLTAFCNQRAWSIEQIRPYAAWDLSHGAWAVAPPHLPEHSLKDFSPEVIAHARAVAAEARAILRMAEPLRTREATALWNHIREHRCQAFSPEGTGWDDPGNVDEKYLAYAPGGLLGKIRELAFAKTAAWSPEWPENERSWRGERRLLPLTDLIASDRNMREVLSSGRTSETVGAIHVWPRDDMPGYEIGDGHHRVADAIRRGETHIDSEVEPYPDEEHYDPPFYDFSPHMHPRTGVLAKTGAAQDYLRNPYHGTPEFGGRPEWSHTWFHGTRGEPDFGVRRKDSEEARRAALPPEQRKMNSGWTQPNQHLGIHFSPLHEVGHKFAPSTWSGPTSIAHVRLRGSDPAHFPNEDHLNIAMADWASQHYPHWHDDKLNGTMAWNYSDQEGTHRDFSHVPDDPGQRWRLGQKAQSLLTWHPHMPEILRGFKAHLREQGHHGITYGNDVEGPYDTDATRGGDASVKAIKKHEDWPRGAPKSISAIADPEDIEVTHVEHIAPWRASPEPHQRAWEDVSDQDEPDEMRDKVLAWHRERGGKLPFRLGAAQNPPCCYCGESLDDDDVRDGASAHEECQDIRWCKAHDDYHDDPGEAEDHNSTYTDWSEHLPFASGIHRGITVRLPAHVHAVVHDEARPRAERAGALIGHLHDNPADHSDEGGHAGGYGVHWTDHEPIARAWGTGEGAMFGPTEEQRSGRSSTHVVMHAASPDEEHIETDPEKLSGRNLLGFGHDRSEREVPLKASAPVHLTGISWKRGGESEWNRHDFAESGHHIAAAAFNPWTDGDADHPEMVPLDNLHGVASMNHPGLTIGEVWEYHHPEDEARRHYGDEAKTEEAEDQAGLRDYAEQYETIPGHLTTCEHGSALEDGEHRYMAARDAGLEVVPVRRAQSCAMPELHQFSKTAALAVKTADRDEQLAAMDPRTRASALAQEHVRLYHPKLMMPLQVRNGQSSVVLSAWLAQAGHPGAADAYIAEHRDPGAMHSSTGRGPDGEPAVILHPDRKDYGTLAHEAAHLIADHETGRQPGEPHGPDGAHGDHWAGHYARLLNGLSPGAGDDFLAQRDAEMPMRREGALAGYQPPQMPPRQHAAHTTPDFTDYRRDILEVAKNPEPGTVVWRSEQRPKDEDPRPQSVGIHWTVNPDQVIHMPDTDTHHTVVYQGRLHDPGSQVIPRSHPMWGGRHRSMDSEAEIRLRPGASVHVEGTWKPTGPDRVPEEGTRYFRHRERLIPMKPERMTEGGWDWHPAGTDVPVRHGGQGAADYSEFGIHREASAKPGVSQRPKRTPGSAMVYLDVPEGTVQPHEGMETGHHIALAYLPRKIGDEDFEAVKDRARQAAARHAPMKATISGGMIFPPGTPPDRRRASVVPVHAPGIHELHDEFADFDRAHYETYTPHVTRAQLGGHQGDPPPHPEASFPVTHVHVRRGDEVHSFPLTGMQREGAADEEEPKSYYHVSYERFPRGHMLTPQGRGWTNFESSSGEHVHMTDSEDNAERYRYHLWEQGYPEQHKYVVRPTGPVEPDPDDPEAVRTRHPVEVMDAPDVDHEGNDEWDSDWFNHRTAVSGYEGLTGKTAMIYLDLPPGTVRLVPGGIEDHHVTLVYLGKNVSDKAFAEACRRTQEAAAQCPPMDGVLRGIDIFPPSKSSDGKVPAFVPAYIGGIGRLRRMLEDLSASEYKDYRPHVSLAYLEEGDSLPAPHPAVPLRFTRVHVKRGDEVVSFPLTGGTS